MSGQHDLLFLGCHFLFLEQKKEQPLDLVVSILLGQMAYNGPSLDQQVTERDISALHRLLELPEG